MITKEQLYEIFSEESQDWIGCNVTRGLNIINKYTDLDEYNAKDVSSEILYSISVDRVVELNFLPIDLRKLRQLNWMISDDALACFV